MTARLVRTTARKQAVLFFAILFCSVAMMAQLHPGNPNFRGGRVRLDEKIMEGLRVFKVDPQGPSKCVMCAHITGTVVLRAFISKNGRVERLSVVSGPHMLRDPVLKAVKQWRYQPFIWSGNRVPVETTITVHLTWPPNPKP